METKDEENGDQDFMRSRQSMRKWIHSKLIRLMIRPKDQKKIRCKSLHKIKRNTESEIIKYKAILIPNVFHKNPKGDLKSAPYFQKGD